MSDKQYTAKGPVAFSTQANSVVLAPNTGSINDSIHIKHIEVGNSSGANAAVGCGYKLPNAMYKAGQWDDSATASYTDDTTDAQSTTTGDFLTGTSPSDNNDGFVVQALSPFNVVSFKMNGASSGGGVASVTYTYWNGTAWTAMTPVVTADYTSTTAQCFAFLTPPDWAALAAADTPVATDGLTTGMYAIKVSWATKPTTFGSADFIALTKLIDYVEVVGDGASIARDFGDLLIPHRASVVPFCSVANAANWCLIEYRQGA